MRILRLTRRTSLLLPLLLAACGGDQQTVFRRLRYDYLPPISLNVRSVDIEARFAPSGVPPDIGGKSPVDPIATLRQMAEDRLKALGNADRAVFSISDASLIRRDDLIRGSMEVTLEIVTDDGRHAGYAQARVSRRHTGHIDDLQATLYEMVSGMMDSMNVELEFQAKQHLQTWLAAPPAPAETAPVAASPLANPTRR